LVYGLAILDSVQTILTTADAFHWFVYGFGNLETLDSTFLNPWDLVMLDSIIGFIGQLFYCWRIYVLRKTLVIPAMISAIAAMACAAGVATAVKSSQLGKLSLVSTLITTQTIWMVGTVVSDIAIAGVISWTLHKATRNSVVQTRTTISRVIWLTVETNALTASAAVLTLILFFAFPTHTSLIAPPVSILGKLYFNCLIAVLRNRTPRVGESSGSHGMAHASIVPNPHRFRLAEEGIHVTRTQKVHVDSFDPVLELGDRSDMSIYKTGQAF